VLLVEVTTTVVALVVVLVHQQQRCYRMLTINLAGLIFNVDLNSLAMLLHLQPDDT
jgi:hypothetical protein